MLTIDTTQTHPCEDLAEAIMERAGAGGLLVIILKRNHPTECISFLPLIPAAMHAAAGCMRDLARSIDAKADEVEALQGEVSAPGGSA